MGKKKAPSQPLQNFLDPQKYYNHGDNPAFKNFMKISMQNARDQKVIDHRTAYLDRGQKFMMARNWDDFLQRDLKGITFPRAWCLFMLNTAATITALVWTRRLLPVGKFGIRNVTQTSLYHNFGPIGVAGACGIGFAGVYTWWKTFKFTLHKFYRHVLMQDRNWLLEESRVSKYGQYTYSDNILSNQANIAKSPTQYYMGSLPARFQPSYKHPYQAPQ